MWSSRKWYSSLLEIRGMITARRGNIPSVGLAADFPLGVGTGIARYQRDLLTELAHSLPYTLERAISYEVFRPLNRAERPEGLPEPLKFTRCSLPGKFQRLLNLVARVPIEKIVPGLTKVDVIHSLVPERLCTALPWVVTVHDVAWRHFGREYETVFSPQMRVEAEAAIASADWLLPVSNVTADGLIAGGIDARRIVVAPLGVDPKFSTVTAESITSVRKKYALPERFVAYVGTFFPRKNLATLIRAIKDSCHTSAPPLVLAGPPPAEGFDHWEIDGAQIRHLGYLDEGELPGFYAAAHVLAFPSFFEGFGLPLVEAMAAGTPVVASNLKVFGEVAGDAFLSFDPHAIDAASQLRDTIDQLWSDDRLRADLIAAGKRRAAQFTWEACCKIVLETYAQAAQAGSYNLNRRI